MTNTTIKFGSYKEFKPQKPVSKIHYKYPWDRVVNTGQEYGFFVGVKKKPIPPTSLKYRNWAILPAEHEGEKGFYVYIKSFTNGYSPEV